MWWFDICTHCEKIPHKINLHVHHLPHLTFFFFLVRTLKFHFLQLSSVTQLCPTLCDHMDYSTPGFPVLHHLLRLAQTHVHQVSDAIQPSHPLSSPSPALNLFQHQGLFQWVSSLHQVAKVLEFQVQLQDQSFQWIFRINFLYNWLVWFPCCPSDSQEFPRTPQFKRINFFSAQRPWWSNSNLHTWLLEKPWFWWAIVGEVMSLLFCLGLS